MTPLFEIPGRTVSRETWRECLHAPEVSHLTVRGADDYSKTLGPPEGADDPQSPHYLGRVKVWLVDAANTLPTDVDAFAETEWRRRCLAWKELCFEADLTLAPGDPPRTPREGDCLQVFGYVGTLLEWVPQFSATERQRVEYTVRVEWE